LTPIASRDHTDAEHRVREIHLHACVRIGELSRELDKAEPLNGHGAGLPTSGKTKADALADAKISTSAAYRYEELAGGREEQAQASGRAAMEHYFATSRAAGEPASMSGLRGAIREALVATLGEPSSAKKMPAEVRSVKAIGDDWMDFTGAVKRTGLLVYDLPSIASRCPEKLRPLLLEKARERQVAAGTANLRNSQLVQNYTNLEAGRSRDKAAEKFGLSPRTVERAVTVLKHATPEVIAKSSQ